MREARWPTMPGQPIGAALHEVRRGDAARAVGQDAERLARRIEQVDGQVAARALLRGGRNGPRDLSQAAFGGFAEVAGREVDGRRQAAMAGDAEAGGCRAKLELTVWVRERATDVDGGAAGRGGRAARKPNGDPARAIRDRDDRRQPEPAGLGGDNAGDGHDRPDRCATSLDDRDRSAEPSVRASGSATDEASGSEWRPASRSVRPSGREWRTGVASARGSERPSARLSGPPLAKASASRLAWATAWALVAEGCRSRSARSHGSGSRRGPFRCCRAGRPVRPRRRACRSAPMRRRAPPGRRSPGPLPSRRRPSARGRPRAPKASRPSRPGRWRASPRAPRRSRRSAAPTAAAAAARRATRRRPARPAASARRSARRACPARPRACPTAAPSTTADVEVQGDSAGLVLDERLAPGLERTEVRREHAGHARERSIGQPAGCDDRDDGLRRRAWRRRWRCRGCGRRGAASASGVDWCGRNRLRRLSRRREGRLRCRRERRHRGRSRRRHAGGLDRWRGCCLRRR